MTTLLSPFEFWQVQTFGNVLRNGTLIPAEKITGMSEYSPTYPAARSDQDEPEDRPSQWEQNQIFNRENPETWNEF